MTRRFTSTMAEPYPRGLEFGRAHAAQIGTTVADYLLLFELKSVVRTADLPAEVDRLGAAALDRVEAWAPELAEEIRGIAVGAGIAVERIAAINARTEILATLQAGVEECSTVVTVGTANPVAMQNWDWYEAMANNWLQWTIPHPDGRMVTTVTEFGMVGKIGMSERGVGTMFNILHHRDDGIGEIGVPVHVVARRILDLATDAADALRICESAFATGVSASTSITVVDRSTAVMAELWPGGVGQIHPGADGLLVRTNHFLSAPACGGDTGPDGDTDTLQRLAYLRDRLGGRAGDVDRAEVFVALTDDTSGVCCHPTPGDEPRLRHATLATVMLDPHEGTLEVSDGSPCRAVPPVRRPDSVPEDPPGG
jgi:isopenicillin-N N-acyltransferase-like protein